MKLLIATHNPSKINEFKAFLAPLNQYGIEILTLSDLSITDEPEETGATFAENAEIKAHYYAKKSGLPVLADDGGFEIDALDGEPGVKSNRWLGYKATDQQLIDHTLQMMQHIPEGKRQARLKLCLYYFNPANEYVAQQAAEIEGVVATAPSAYALKGFPFRALHLVGGIYYDQLTAEQHKAINHRRRAVQAITPAILQDLNAENS